MLVAPSDTTEIKITKVRAAPRREFVLTVKGPIRFVAKSFGAAPARANSSKAETLVEG